MREELVDIMSNPDVKATELFPELSTDIDRRISHAELRLKFWVVGGVLANVLTIIGLGAPAIYYLGSLSTQFSEVVVTSEESIKRDAEITRTLEARSRWMDEREVWENWAEDKIVETHGGSPPRFNRGTRSQQ